jgi:hypothetical protein
MDRDGKVSPGTAMIVTVTLALVSWAGLLALIGLTLAVF